MMVYTFIHKPSHIQEEYNKKEIIKKKYIRDLVQSYGVLLSHEEFLKEDVVDFTEGSLLKNLDRRYVGRYQEWLKKEALLRTGRSGKTSSQWPEKLSRSRLFLKWLH